VVGDGIGEDSPLPERLVSSFPYGSIALVGEQDDDPGGNKHTRSLSFSIEGWSGIRSGAGGHRWRWGRRWRHIHR